MYEAFFGLKEKPFSLLPDPDFLFLSGKHSLALSMLEYSLAGQAGFCAITGEVGSGKTTLIRMLLRRTSDELTVGLISNTHGTLTEIAGWALIAFGHRPKGQTRGELYQELMHFLIGEYGAGRRAVLIIDEAQNLTIGALEELRLLSNINSEKDLLLQMILVGQPELLKKLKRPQLRQFAQRISVSYHLGPLNFAETRQYIHHRLQIAGGDRKIFSDMAIGAIQYFSGGVPRVINGICDMAMVYAFADGTREVDLDLVFRVVSDRQASGIAPFIGSGRPEDPDVASGISNLVRDALDAKARSTSPRPGVTGSATSTGQPQVLTADFARETEKGDDSGRTPAQADEEEARGYSWLNGRGSKTNRAGRATKPSEMITTPDQRLHFEATASRSTYQVTHQDNQESPRRLSWLRRRFSRAT